MGMGMFKRSNYLKDVNPRGMFADFRAVWTQAGNNRWRIAGLASLCTLGLFYLMVQQGGQAPHQPPKVTYISSWRADRSNAEIRESNIRNQKIKDVLEAEQAVRDEKVKGIYRELGRMSGLDVKRIEAEAKAEREAEKREIQRMLAERLVKAPAGE